ncbi:hypothetical protein, partial [Arenicella xantha]|uniref:hypothetical protein n=1 Tax=Arenicella xantha TaxID=644221 RepID=UPI001B87038A
DDLMHFLIASTEQNHLYHLLSQTIRIRLVIKMLVDQNDINTQLTTMNQFSRLPHTRKFAPTKHFLSTTGLAK